MEYLMDQADILSVSTLQRRLTSISKAYQLKSVKSQSDDPGVRTVWRGIRKKKGIAQKGKAPVLIEDIRRMVRSLPENLIGCRDRAVLLVGFAGLSDDQNWWPWIIKTSRSPEMVSESRSGARRPTKKGPGVPSEFHTAPIRRPARFDP